MLSPGANKLFDFQWLRNKNPYGYRMLCQELPSQLDPTQLIKYATSILKRDPSDRFEEELLLIVKATEQLHFFKEMNLKQKNIDNRLHTQCCQKMTYKSFSQGDIIFKQGDKGENAFIILNGSVNIYTQLDQYIINDLTHKSRKKYEICTQIQKRIHPISVINQARKEKTKNRFSFSVSQIKKLKRQGSKQIDDDQKLLFQTMKIQQTQQIIEDIKIEEEKDKKILEQLQQIGLEMTSGIPPSKLDIDYFFIDGVFKHKYLTELTLGSMFGELALIWNQPRSASVVAKTNVELAVLTSQDYKSLLKDAELNKIEQRIKFFQNYFFRESPRFVTLRYCYNFKKIELTKGNYLVKKGDKVTQIFLIKKGELELLHDQQIINQVSQQQQAELASSQQQLLLAIKQSQMIPPTKLNFQRRVLTFTSGEIIGDIEIMLKIQQQLSTIIVTSEKAKIYALQMNHFNRILSDQATLKKYFFDQANLKFQYHQQLIEKIDKFHKNQYEQIKLNQQLFIIKTNNEQIQQEQSQVLEELGVYQATKINQFDQVNEIQIQNYTPKKNQSLSSTFIKIKPQLPILKLSNTKNQIEIPGQAMTCRVNSKIQDIEDFELQTNSLKGVLNKIQLQVNHKSSKKVLSDKKKNESNFRKEIQRMEEKNESIKKYNRKHLDLLPENEKKKIEKSNEISKLMRQELNCSESIHQKKFIDYKLMRTEMSTKHQSKSIDQSSFKSPTTPVSKSVQPLLKGFQTSSQFIENRTQTEQEGGAQSPGTKRSIANTVISNFIDKLNNQPIIIKSKHNLFRTKPQSRILLSRYSQHSTPSII